MHDPRRAKLALTLGLAEALDLDEGQALKLREVVDRFAQKRQPLMQQQHDAMQVLRAAASAEKADAAAVDQAIGKLHEARAQLQALDKELVSAVTKDLAPQKKARAVLFFGRFHARMAHHGGPGGRPGFHGRGMGAGRAGVELPGGPGDEMGMLDQGPEDDDL
jgi:Spy/CpxP family protein refolding chaperone